MNKYYLSSLLLLLTLSTTPLHPMYLPAYLGEDMETEEVIQFTKEPDSLITTLEIDPKPNTPVETAMNTVIQKIEVSLNLVEKSNKEVLIDYITQEIYKLPTELRISIKELFLNKCSRKTFFDYLSYLQIHGISQGTGEHIGFFGTKDTYAAPVCGKAGP